MKELALLPRADYTQIGALCLARCDGHRKFSDKTAGQLIEALGIDSIPALYELTKEQLVALDRFGEKKRITC
ncbi:MAG: hypothetical protein R2881_06320 [Eubacteriales bacterium]